VSSIFHKALNIKMSSQQSNNSNYKIDMSHLSPHYQPQIGNRMQAYSNTNLTSNLDLYIPRVSQGTTEDQIKIIFARSRIGIVDYCDLSLTKDKDTKKPQYLSAFVKLISWSDLSGACEDFTKNRGIRLYLSYEGSEFWMILPNKNPLPRSHVNTSQLAAATDKLFEQTEKITEKADKFEDEMRATIAEMRQMILLQQEKIERLEFEVAFLQKDAVKTVEDKAEEPEYEEMSIPANWNSNEECEEMPIPKMNRIDTVYNGEKIKERDFEAEVDALLDLPMPMMQGVAYKAQMPSLPRNDVEVDEEEFFARPPPLLTRSVSAFLNKDDECIFSIRPKRELNEEKILKPAPIVSTVTLSLPEIVAKNPERAIESRDFCGNC